MEAALAASEAKSRELADSLRNLNELLEQRVVAEAQERVRIWDAARREISEISRHLTMASMVASISHEVSQPLAAIILNAGASLRLLTKAKPDMDDVRAALKDIVDDGQRAHAVLDGIRSMFRNDHGARTTVTVNDLIGEVLAVVRGELDVHQVSLRSELGDGLPTVLAAPTQLQQVLLNLIMNAIEAMGPVTTQERVLIVKSEIGESGNVQITVEDTGSGIDPSLVDRIFEAFFTTKALGMGMGLSICRSIVESTAASFRSRRADPMDRVFASSFQQPRLTLFTAIRQAHADHIAMHRVRLWHFSDLPRRNCDVRWWGQSGSRIWAHWRVSFRAPDRPRG